MYTLNKDLCTVDFKTFNPGKEDFYPILSLCFSDAASDKMFSLDNYPINQSTYIDFLEGKHFNASLLKINYEHIAMNISDYVIGDWMKPTKDKHPSTSLPSENEAIFKNRFSWFDGGIRRFYHCYPLRLPQISGLSYYGITLKNSIFRNGTRPPDRGFMSLLHYPNQILRSTRTKKYGWPERDRYDKFIMRFKINGVEILTRRRNGLQACDDNWKDHDDAVLVQHLKKIGCRAPYQYPSKQFPICNTRENLTKTTLDFLSNDFESHPPCKAMEKVYYTFEESSSPESEEGQFEVGLYFFDQQFKEILRSR